MTAFEWKTFFVWRVTYICVHVTQAQFLPTSSKHVSPGMRFLGLGIGGLSHQSCMSLHIGTNNIVGGSIINIWAPKLNPHPHSQPPAQPLNKKLWWCKNVDQIFHIISKSVNTTRSHLGVQVFTKTDIHFLKWKVRYNDNPAVSAGYSENFLTGVCSSGFRSDTLG